MLHDFSRISRILNQCYGELLPEFMFFRRHTGSGTKLLDDLIVIQVILYMFATMNVLTEFLFSLNIKPLLSKIA